MISAYISSCVHLFLFCAVFSFVCSTGEWTQVLAHAGHFATELHLELL